MSRFFVNITFVLFFVWSISSMQISSQLYSEDSNSLMGYILVLTLLSLELISILFLFLNFSSIIKNKLNITILIWFIYSLLITLIYSKNIFSDIRELAWWPLIYFLFYNIAVTDKNNKNTGIFIYKIIPSIFIVFLIQFFISRSANNIIYTISGKEILFSANQIFYIALLLPFAFLFKNQKIKYIFLFTVLIATLFSFKRSVIISTSLVIIASIYFDAFKNKKNGLIKGLLIISLVLFISIYVYKSIDNITEGFITERFENISEDEGSGRINIYERVWDRFIHQTWEYRFFGIGFNNMRNNRWIAGGDYNHFLSAHNDFLEILVDFGIIGLILYLNFVFQLFRRMLKLIKQNSKYNTANIAAMIIFVVMSMVSHLVIYPTYFAYLAIIWAITEGQKRYIYSSPHSIVYGKY